MEKNWKLKQSSYSPAAIASFDSGAVRSLEGAMKRMRSWDVYVLEDMATGYSAEECAPWMRLQLLDGDTVDEQLVRKAVQERCPFDVLCLDLLVRNRAVGAANVG